MELRYNLVRQDFKRGLLLHEKRPKGAFAVVRKVEWFAFLGLALFSAAVLCMLLTLLATGQWEEDFGSVFSLSVVTLAGSGCFLWLLSARRRAFHGGRLLAGEDGYFGPRVLSLTPEGVAVAYGVSRRVEAYDAIREVWEKKGFVLLCLKAGIWEVIPPGAFAGPEERRAFLTVLSQARQGRLPPREAAGTSVPLEPVEEGAFVLRYTWTPEGLREALLRANLAFLRTRLYWRPAVVVAAILSLPMLVAGLLSLTSALTAAPLPRVGEVASAIGMLCIGVGLCLPWLSFVPNVMAWAIRRQEKKDAFGRMLDGPATDVIGPEGVDSLRPGEREELLAQRTVFQNSEKIARAVSAAYEALDGAGEEAGAVSTSSAAARE